MVKSCTTAEGNGKTQSCTTVVEVGDGKTHFTPFVAISSVQGSFFRVISPEFEEVEGHFDKLLLDFRKGGRLPDISLAPVQTISFSCVELKFKFAPGFQ